MKQNTKENRYKSFTLDIYVKGRKEYFNLLVPQLII